MSRRFTALKPQLNRIRAWAHEGSTDAWIAHQLETTADAVRAFRQEHGIERGGAAPPAPITPDSVVEAMLAEEEAALEAAASGAPPLEERSDEREPEPEREPAAVRAPRRRTRAKPADDAPETEQAPSEQGMPLAEQSPPADAPVADAPARTSRGRGSRGGAARRTATATAFAEPADGAPEAVPDDGEVTSEEEPARSPAARKRGRRRGRGRGAGRGLEARLLPGSVLLLDPSVTADPAFQEHWQDAGPLRVEISADAIVLRRAAAEAEPDHTQG
ncbi:MAG: hypothetical protein QOD37_1045 [Gaiellales bacterium]|nr:hypothetical protein [Gaiellales bacterium]